MSTKNEYLIALIKCLGTNNKHHHIVIEDGNLGDGFLRAWLGDMHGASEDAECMRLLLKLNVDQRESLIYLIDSGVL